MNAVKENDRGEETAKKYSQAKVVSINPENKPISSGFKVEPFGNRKSNTVNKKHDKKAADKTLLATGKIISLFSLNLGKVRVKNSPIFLLKIRPKIKVEKI